MRFAADIWLWGALFSLVLAGILVAQGLRLSRDRARFGQEDLVSGLLSAKTGLRRAVRGVLSCLAVALLFIAAAQPQYGKGTRILPATNLDVVLVLDYSKSMYARDVSPSRIGRAKVEMGRLIRELSGARFAAVAFAGESISFPLTSDGSAIAQFFRGMEPNDLPVGGTAIARALESGRQLLERDPLSKNHERVMILVTDGEDLEGDPVAVAQAAKSDGIRLDVVQIGGESPEPIPEVDEHGVSKGLRRDAQGQIMTTALSPEGQAQLASIAREGGGTLVRAQAGQVGLDEMTASLRKLMSEELSERVETVFADIYHYPLALGVVLLLLEALIGASQKHHPRKLPPKGTSHRRVPRRLRGAAAVLLALSSLGCAEVDQVFLRESPVVNDAILALKESDPKKSAELLMKYLETGACEGGVIGAGERARSYGDASLDLALALSAVAGGKEEKSAPDPAAALSQGKLPPGLDPNAPGALKDPQAEGGISEEAVSSIDCALRVLAAISGNSALAPELRARAHYLAGNLEMLRSQYDAAIASYDLALLLTPGVSKEAQKKPLFANVKVDPLGLWVADNRALALRLQKEKEEQEKQKEQENQSNQDEEPKDDQQSEDQGKDGEPKDEKDKQESENEENEEKQEGDQGKEDEQQDPKEKDEQQKQDGESESEPNPSDSPPQDPEDSPSSPDGQEQAAAENQPSEARDQRMLDLLEQAPTLQKHDAEKRKAQGVRFRSTMEDK